MCRQKPYKLNCSNGIHTFWFLNAITFCSFIPTCSICNMQLCVYCIRFRYLLSSIPKCIYNLGALTFYAIASVFRGFAFDYCQAINAKMFFFDISMIRYTYRKEIVWILSRFTYTYQVKDQD